MSKKKATPQSNARAFKMTCAEIASASGVHPSTVCRYLNGNRIRNKEAVEAAISIIAKARQQMIRP